MSRSPRFGRLVATLRQGEAARRAGVPFEEWQPPRVSRRRFLVAGGATAVLVAAGCSDDSGPEAVPLGDDPPVVIVGGGLAGLTAAYRLTQAGRPVAVHEASERVGGRVRTLRDFSPGRTVESGGEFVNSNHDALRGLAKELGLAEVDTYPAYPDDAGETMFFGGERPAYTDLLDEWWEISAAVAEQYDAVGPEITAANHTPEAARLDQISLAEWIETEVPGGLGSLLGNFLAVTFEGEYAGSVEDLNSLTLIESMGPTAANAFDPLGNSDERYQIADGSDAVATALNEALPAGSVTLGSSLVALSSDGGQATATFDGPGGTTDVTAGEVVLALPFSILRTVDLKGAGLSDVKLRAIREQGMGTNAKLHIEHSERAWREVRSNGISTSDTGLGVTWEESIAQDGDAGLLIAFTGGTTGASYPATEAHAEAPPAVLEEGLAAEKMVFGQAVADAATGNAHLDSWVHDPFVGGSYAYWGLGQYTGFRGAEAGAEPPFHFAGEHTSLEHQGFMNGAVETGDRVAAEILG
jgi:monoamine oxidase